MTIVLPAAPLPQSATPKPIDFGGWQQPVAGGTISRLDRLGNRFSMDVTMPRMRPEPNGRIWVSRVTSAISADAQMPFPQPGLSIGAPGTPVVDGGGQGGLALAVRGLSQGYTIREGQFFNVFDASGRAYLHKADVDAIADSGGKALLTIWPMLRTSPNDGSAVNLVAPVIMGQLTGNQNGWTLERAGTQGLQFTITERR